MNRFLYMDNAATTCINKKALDDMKPYLTKMYFNPSGTYRATYEIKDAIERARGQVARVIGALPEEIYFTSGGTESDNWAIDSALEYGDNNHIITSKIEHHAILNSCKKVEKKGARVTYVSVLRNGVVNKREIEDSICDSTKLISIMAANNEVGTIQPIAEIGRIAKRNNIVFHTDAVQGFLHMYINVNNMNIDMLSISAHKFGGPKGVGAMYIRKGLMVDSFMRGGMQESGMRAGTYNVAGIVGMGSAAGEYYKSMGRTNAYVRKMRDYMCDEIMMKIEDCRINGDMNNRLPGNVNVCIRGVNGKNLVKALGERGICVSTGSVCNSVSVKPSHVLMAMGLSEEEALSSIRITLSGDNKREDVEYFVSNLRELVALFRNKNL